MKYKIGNITLIKQRIKGLNRHIYWTLFGIPCYHTGCKGRMQVIKRKFCDQQVYLETYECKMCNRTFSKFTQFTYSWRK